MSASLWFYLGASLLVLVLASYAGYLFWQLRQQRQRREAQRAELEVWLGERDADARQSIQIIAGALLRDELTHTEAAMRIAWLSKQVVPGEGDDYSVFEQLAAATAHIPILADWQALDKKEKRRLTAERLKLEEQYSEFVLAAAQRIAAGQSAEPMFYQA